MKKILSAVLSALFVLTAAAGFAACGKSGGNGGNGGNGAENGITPETAHCVTQPRRPGDGAVVCDHCGVTLYTGEAEYELSENHRYYIFKLDGVEYSAEGKVILPAFYKGRGEGYLPVLEARFSDRNVTSLELSPNVEYVAINSAVEDVSVSGNSAFYESADGVLFDKQMSSLYYYSSAKTAEKYEVPAGTKELEPRSFRENKYLKEAVLPGSVEFVGGFTNCSALETVVLPDGVREIYSDAFSGCTGIESVVIPASVETIGYGAFEGWKSSQTIYVAAEEKPAGWDVNWYDYSDAAVVWGYKG